MFVLDLHHQAVTRCQSNIPRDEADRFGCGTDFEEALPSGYIARRGYLVARIRRGALARSAKRIVKLRSAGEMPRQLMGRRRDSLAKG